MNTASELVSGFRGCQAWLRVWTIAALVVAGEHELLGASEEERATTNVMSMSFDELLNLNVDKVYGASKYDQPVTRAPSSVSIITSDEIQKQGYRTLADALRSVNGIYVPDDRNYSYVGVRGFNRPGDYNSRVLLLVDGHRLNDNVFEQALYGTEGFLDIDTVEDIEVIRGPSSSIYGNNAFFGVVNVVTRSGRSVNGLEATTEAGDNQTYKVGATYGKQFTNGVQLFLSGSWYDTAGERQIYFPEFNTPTNNVNRGIAANSDGDTAYHFFGALDYSELSLSGGWSWRRKVIPTASFETIFNDGGERTTDERAYADLKWEHPFSDELKLLGHIAYDTAWYQGEYPYTNKVSGRILNFDSTLGRWVSTDWQLNWRVADRHTFIFGGDYYDNLTEQQANFNVNPYTLNLDDNRSGWNFGLFAQAELSLLTNLLLNAGARFDDYSTFGNSVNPRVALIYNPWLTTTFKLMYGEAFRAPSPFELYYSYPGQNKANPSLEPETIRTYELDWEQQLPWNLRFTTAAYYYHIRDLISERRDPSDHLLAFENVNVASAGGVELELDGRFAHGLAARASCAFQRAQDDATGAELSNSPRRMAKLNFIAPLWSDKLFAGVDLQYYSDVQTVRDGRTDGMFVANATLFSQRIVKNLEVSVSVYNLSDERHGFSGSFDHLEEMIPLPGRSFRFKATYHF